MVRHVGTKHGLRSSAIGVALAIVVLAVAANASRSTEIPPAGMAPSAPRMWPGIKVNAEMALAALTNWRRVSGCFISCVYTARAVMWKRRLPRLDTRKRR